MVSKQPATNLARACQPITATQLVPARRLGFAPRLQARLALAAAARRSGGSRWRRVGDLAEHGPIRDCPTFSRSPSTRLAGGGARSGSLRLEVKAGTRQDGAGGACLLPLGCAAVRNAAAGEGRAREVARALASDRNPTGPARAPQTLLYPLTAVHTQFEPIERRQRLQPPSNSQVPPQHAPPRSHAPH